MKEQKKSLKHLNIDRKWALFLDRDGVINKKIENDYVRNWEQFEFLPGVLEALKILSDIFGRIIIVTNQRGIGRGFMTEKDLEYIHRNMLNIFEASGIKVDAIYYCPHDYEREICNCRKPDMGMGLQAKKDFPDIDFSRSIMVGDSRSDMEFGRSLGMFTVCISGQHETLSEDIDFCFRNLLEFALFVRKCSKGGI